MRTIVTASVVLALSVTSALATQKPQPKPEPQQPTVHNTLASWLSAKASARANANAIAKGGNATVKNSGNSFNSNKNQQAQGQKQTQSQTATASSNSGGNWINNSNSYKTAAASAYAPSGQTTAPCQKYASAGGQGINFGFSFGLNFDSRECWRLVKAADYKAVYGPSVIRAYYEATDPVLAGIVAKQGTGLVKAKPRKSKKQCACR